MFDPDQTQFHQTRRYDRAAHRWQGRMAALGYALAYRAAIAAMLPAPTLAHRVMDAGCGVGDFAAAYGQGRGTIPILTLVDPAVEMLQAAHTRLSGSTQHLWTHAAVIETLPDLPKQDLILCAHVIEHCPDPRRALVRLGALLSETGVLLLVVSKPHWCNWLIWLSWQHRSHRPAAVKALIHAAGLCCTADMGFSKGPPRRTSHAYRIVLPSGEPSC
jgi:2-polyprenyl-3-methyl-5-hydroxy-6-metoxy-1,4-benzoquinol methylase